ncbi:protein AF1q isoform X1 [Notothenia coriiceps]|uniref:Protein AF1q n=1 Tax=Notothenia coriiceps TaxID=8208 RepID=A0A6I9PG06_9TELE|nr:PREDICTED: protein AF1q isoform X1 [Notothenia coriiceps]
MQKSKSEYESFVFWKALLPEIDLSELSDLSGGAELAGSAAGKERKQEVRKREEEVRKQEVEGEMKEFSSFTYWRAPIGDVDSLLADLLL